MHGLREWWWIGFFLVASAASFLFRCLGGGAMGTPSSPDLGTASGRPFWCQYPHSGCPVLNPSLLLRTWKVQTNFGKNKEVRRWKVSFPRCSHGDAACLRPASPGGRVGRGLAALGHGMLVRAPVQPPWVPQTAVRRVTEVCTYCAPLRRQVRRRLQQPWESPKCLFSDGMREQPVVASNPQPTSCFCSLFTCGQQWPKDFEGNSPE